MSKYTKCFLYDYQFDAVRRMKNGCILNGGVGSGKSRTGLYYYYVQSNGPTDNLEVGKMLLPKDLYIITTARKRDSLEWDDEIKHFGLSTDKTKNLYSNTVVIDSWNNIKKYIEVKDAFFIFDEDRVIGSGAWVKAFLKIVKNNEWILLSATPADTFMDYAPVFVANGFYKNLTEFRFEHVVYSRYSKFPKIERYLNVNKLIRLKDKILITMDFTRPTYSHHEDIYIEYDAFKYKNTIKNRWNFYKDCPIINSAELCFCLRRIVNSDPARIQEVIKIVKEKKKVIIFYNFNYELDILRNADYGNDVQVAEWNGQKHQDIPKSDSFVYLVQFNAGSEGWNCIKTNTMIFYSQNYSYRMMTQAAGRIDRVNTPYTDLYFYHLKSRSSIDVAISKAINSKKKFNENLFTFDILSN